MTARDSNDGLPDSQDGPSQQVDAAPRRRGGGLRLPSRLLRWLARHRTARVVLILALPALLVVAVDLHLRGSRLLELRGKYLLSYAAAVVESAALWGLLLAAASARRGWYRWLAATLFVGLAALTVGGQIYFHGQYATYLNLDATLWGASLSESAFGQVEADASNFLKSVGPPFLMAIVLVWCGRKLVRTRRRTSRVVSVLGLAVVAAAFVIPCSYRAVQASTPDVIYLHAMGGLVKQFSGAQTPSQWRPKRRTPPELPPLAAKPAVKRNVLFILGEGVRLDVGCSDPAEPCLTMPRTHQAMPKRLPLRQMRSNSTTTATELAVLWSGLGPTAGREALHSVPLWFDYAHAAGIESAYWTSHHMLFANSRLYVQDFPTRFQCGATHLDPVADIDLGADDNLLTARVQQELPQLAEPFLAVVQYGNTHVPYLMDPDDAPFQPHRLSRAESDNEAYFNRYKNAVYRQDKTIAELLSFVRSQPFGGRTVIIFTSDHGEQFREHGQLGHTGSLFEVELHVPTWVDAPPGTLTEPERAALADHVDRPVFHTHLTPTVLDLLGLLDAPELAPYVKEMQGSSLLRPEWAERTMVLSNCTGVWGCAFENWGVMRGFRKVHAREWDTSWLCYDVQRDPEELDPLDLDQCAELVSAAEQAFGGLPGRL